MRIRFPILLSAVLLAAAILMAFRDDAKKCNIQFQGERPPGT
jgi:hypothetical protein